MLRRRSRVVRRRLIGFAVAAVLVFAVDQLLKAWVRAGLDRGEQIDVIPGFQISRVLNDGIAFGLFPGRPGVVALLTVAALTAITVGLVTVIDRHPVIALGGGMLVGGSASNLLDRIVLDGVTDYLDPLAWPAFNVADIGIVCGAALVVAGMLIVDGRRADDSST